MNKCYDKEVLDELASRHLQCIVIFKDDYIKVGYIIKDGGKDYSLLPLALRAPILSFCRSHIKKIITFPNGAVFPKDHNEFISKIVDILTLNDLVNKAGYQFL